MTMMKTSATCAAQCWMAREPDCSCSCGGANHGIMAQGIEAGGTMPRRNCLIAGTRYYLAGMDYAGYVRDLAHGFRLTLRGTEHGYTTPSGHQFPPNPNAPGGVTWERKANDGQARWPEIVGWMTAAYAAARDRYDAARAMTARGERAPYVPRPYEGTRPYLLWVREDLINLFDAWREAD